MSHLKSLIKESAEASQSIATMATCDSPDTARRTLRELEDLRHVTNLAINQVEKRAYSESGVRAAA